MKRKLLMLVMLIGYCLSGFAQSQFQTRTAGHFNEVYLNSFSRASVTDFAADDNIYAFSKKLSPKNSGTQLIMQGFGFNIPTNATINNIQVKVRRFKTGNGSVKDYFAVLVRRRLQSSGIENMEAYGFRAQNPDLYPAVETEFIYPFAGSGVNGGLSNSSYQWTPAMINDTEFGVSIATQSTGTTGSGAVIVYDLLEITVEYSLPAARTSLLAAETPLVNQPTVYPNPFTTHTNIHFYATESGPATVELYTVIGTKVKTLFAGDVVKGQAYSVEVAEAQFPKGIYIYSVNSGGQKYSGRIIKQE